MNSFSIIVVSYNTKKEFLKTLNSIKKQTYKKYEIIIVDGSSTDGTINLIKKIKNKKVNFIIEKDNGIYDAMNKGIKIAKGEWALFLNSGDIFNNPDVLKKANDLIDKKSDIVFGNAVINNKTILYHHLSKNFSSKTIYIPFSHQSVFSKTKILKKNLFNLNYKICSDFNFFTKQYKKNKRFQKINLTIATVISAGLSDSNRFKVFYENFIILKKNKFLKGKIISLIIFFTTMSITKLTKKILPNFIVNMILKMKYHNKIKRVS